MRVSLPRNGKPGEGAVRRGGRRQRWFFATDVHGSDRCYRKFLAAAQVYEADVLLLGGDVAGKGIVPLPRHDDDTYTLRFQGTEEIVRHDGLAEACERIRFNGLYPYICPLEDVAALGDATYRDSVFAKLIAEQLRGWARLTEERLSDCVRCIVTPGNDDPPAVDLELNAAERIECPEGEVVEVGGVALASLGNTNETPWHTDREYSEHALAEQIDAILQPSTKTHQSLVFNFHCPPYDSGLDVAAKLDDDFRPVVKGGAVVSVPVGSVAVKQAIERYAPVVGLHGHIHESMGAARIGRSRCYNPGSDYSSGVLKGLIVDFDSKGEYCEHLFTCG